VNELVTKIQYLDETLKREEKARIEMRDKLKITEDSNRDVVNFIKSI
jgi:hypothetical protein